MTAARSNWTGIVFGLCLACLAAYQQFKLPPALPVMLQVYGYDRALAGAFMSVFAVAGLTLSWLLGRVLASIGLVGPTLGALALMALGSAMTLAAPDAGWLVLAGRALEGVGFAVLAIVGPVLANANAAPRHLPVVVGLTASWIPVGQLAAVALAPLAVAWYGWQALWLVGIGAALAMAAWTLRLGARGTVDLSAGAPHADAPSGRNLRPHQRRALVLASGVFMLWASQYFAYMTWLPQFLVEAHGLSLAMAALGYTVPVAVLIATNLAVGMVLRRGMPVGPLLVAGLVSQVAVWGLVPVTGGGVPGLVSLVIYGIGAGICPTCLFAMPSIIVGPGRAAAAAFGTIMTGRNLGVLVGPVLLAEAFKVFGGWDIAGPIFAGVTGLALGLGVWLAVSLGGARYGTRR